jgi:hypothetical protein
LVSHHTARVIWGGVVPPQSVVPHQRADGAGLQVNGIRTHRYPRHVAAIVVLAASVSTSPERTMCDLARTLDLVELVVLGDRLVRREVTTPIRLIQAADDWHGPSPTPTPRGSAGAPGVDSPPESRLRMLGSSWPGCRSPPSTT